MTRVYRSLAVGTLLLAACSPAKKEAPPKRDPDPVIAATWDSLSKDTTNWQMYDVLADQLRHRKRYDEAQRAAEKAFMLEPSPAFNSQLEMAKVHAAANRGLAAINLIKGIEKKKAEGEAGVDEVKLAEVYAILGDTAAVFRWLERAKTAKSPNLTTVNNDDDFAWVRKDPRWEQLFGKQN